MYREQNNNKGIILSFIDHLGSLNSSGGNIKNRSHAEDCETLMEDIPGESTNKKKSPWSFLSIFRK